MVNYLNTIKTTIQLDKLVFSCVSIGEEKDRFDFRIKTNQEYAIQKVHQFGDIYLLKVRKRSKYYKYSYRVFYKSHYMGIINFVKYGGLPHTAKVK